MKQLSRRDLRVRASKLVDIQKGLQDLTSGLHEIQFEKAIIVGKSARLAANLRGQEVIEPADRINYMGLEIGINPGSMRHEILPLLQSLGMVTARTDSSGKLVRIEENVPRLGNLLQASAEKWEQLEPSRTEIQGVNTVEALSRHPILKDDVESSLSELPSSEMNSLLSSLKAGSLIDDYSTSEGTTVIYSPTIWDERLTDALKMYASLSSIDRKHLDSMSSILRDYPGMPKEMFRDHYSLLGSAIKSGYLELGSTQTPSGRSDFLFLPDSRMKLREEDITRGDLFDKTKSIMSAVRHGQHHAPIWKIREPVAILNALLERGKLRPYSGARQQYAMVEIKGIVGFNKVAGLWETYLIDTPENIEAATAARDIFSSGHPLTQDIVEPMAQALLVQGSFMDPLRNRTRLRKPSPLDEASFKTLLDRMRGESVDY